MQFLTSPHCCAQRVIATAAALSAQSQANERRPLLQGRHIGLLCRTGDEEAANLREAALALGARVSTIPVDRWDPQTPEEVQRLASVLERLYDAVACEGVDAVLVRQIRRVSQVPLCADIARTGRTIGQPGIDEPNRQFFLLQALLLQLLPR